MKRVLIIEDNRMNVKLFKEILKRHYFIETLNNGDNILDIIEAFKPNIIIMDINLPGKNGIDILKELRQNDITSPVIAVTADAMDGDEERILNEGFDNYMSKPICIKTFLAKVNEHLNG